MRVVWIGLGNMGKRTAKNVAEKGPQSCLVAYNHNKAQAASLLGSVSQSSAITVADSIDNAVALSEKSQAVRTSLL